MAESPGVLEALIQRSHLAVPDQIPGLIAQQADRLGMSAAVLYRVDLDQRWLVPLPIEGTPPLPPLAVDGSMAGRCYRLLEVLEAPDEGGGRTVWVPVLDGTERMGVLRLDVVPGQSYDPDLVRAFAGLIAELVMDVLLVAYVSMAFVVGRSRTPRPARVVPLRTGPVLGAQPAYARVAAEA